MNDMHSDPLSWDVLKATHSEWSLEAEVAVEAETVRERSRRALILGRMAKLLEYRQWMLVNEGLTKAPEPVVGSQELQWIPGMDSSSG